MDGSRVLGRVQSLGLSVVTLEDAGYPPRLRLVEMPPPVLFVHGSQTALTPKHAVAIVGTRWPTDKGRLIGGWIASALARAGAVVVSGLAVGIDGVAHAAVVAEGRQTVAVLGGGHARLFPRSHARLADAIAANAGAVISELLPDTAPTRGSFPRRNRLVSGLSDATVVVEAGRRSGALITAGWALEQGRGCFLVPGAFDSPASAGCHAFLRSFPGEARVVCGIPELLEDLDLVAAAPDGVLDTGVDSTQPASRNTHGASVAGAGRAATLAALGSVERALAEMLTEGPASVDDLSHRTSLGAAAILSALTLLELRGLVAAAGGRYVAAGALAREPGRTRARARGRE
jgi:DNA processing protein